MEFKKEKMIAYWAAAVLLVVGVVSYAVFPERKPEEPVRIMFKATAGNVLFDHKEHASEDGYGIECTECHHEWDQKEGGEPLACSECHYKDEDEEAPKISDAFHELCIGCHEDFGGGPVECSQCHVL